MHIVDQTKLILAVVFAIIGLGLLASARGTRGFNQRKQAGVLCVLGALLMAAIALGYLDLHGLLGR